MVINPLTLQAKSRPIHQGDRVAFISTTAFTLSEGRRNSQLPQSKPQRASPAPRGITLHRYLQD